MTKKTINRKLEMGHKVFLKKIVVIFQDDYPRLMELYNFFNVDYNYFNLIDYFKESYDNFNYHKRKGLCVNIDNILHKQKISMSYSEITRLFEFKQYDNLKRFWFTPYERKVILKRIIRKLEGKETIFDRWKNKYKIKKF